MGKSKPEFEKNKDTWFLWPQEVDLVKGYSWWDKWTLQPAPANSLERRANVRTETGDIPQACLVGEINERTGVIEAPPKANAK